MPLFTLVLSGVPQNVYLPDLSANLDRLFNTDDIRSFTLRDLPNHPKTNRRQIALDFPSSFDAMTAQEKLEGYQYELDDGRQYILRAKVNKSEEYMPSDSRSPERCGNSWYGGYGDDWIALSLPSVDQQMYERVHARLDAQLDVLEKQKMVIEKEKEILREKQRLKRDYGSMVSSFCQYEVPSRLWMQEFGNGQYFKNTNDESVSSSKRSRSGSKEKRSRSRVRHRRSRHRSYRRSRYERRSPSVHHRERSASRDRHRAVEDRQRSSKEKRSRNRRSWDRRSRERRFRQRSRSREHRSRSGEPSSTSREPRSREVSRSRERKMNDREQHIRRSRSVEKRSTLLAIMPKSPEGIKPPVVRPTVSYLEDILSDETEFVKETRIKIEKDDTKLDTEVTNTQSKKTNISKEERIAKFNGKISKRENLEARVKEVSNDVMVLIIILLDQLIEKNNVKISASNKVQLIKELEKLVQERVEPLARKRNNSDVKVLRKYKKLYPIEDDMIMIKERLDKIPKLESEPRVTATVSSADVQQCRTDSIICEVDAERQDLTKDFTLIDIVNEIKQEIKEDVDDKKSIIEIKQEEKKVRAQKLGSQIGTTQLTYVLRQMLKGHGFTPRQEIISTFRAQYPMEDDENFMRNVIKDINEGKYPHLFSPHVDITEDDRPDDVVVIEKRYDVVTVAESDDDCDSALPTSTKICPEDNETNTGLPDIDIMKSDVTNDTRTEITEIDSIRLSLNAPVRRNVAEEHAALFCGPSHANNYSNKVVEEATDSSRIENITEVQNKQNDKKEEIDAEEKLDDSSLQTVPGSAPRVTAIMINTSEEELICIGRGEEVKIIKQEEDAEANLLNDIQEDINNYKFWFG